MSLNGVQKNFIRLVLRSPDTGDGWRLVSRHLEPVTQINAQEMPELFETRRDDDQFKIRLTERGKIVAEYI